MLVVTSRDVHVSRCIGSQDTSDCGTLEIPCLSVKYAVENISKDSDDIIIDGGNGNDELSGGNENDLIFGRGGRDTLLGGAGSNTLNGGGGDDLLMAGNGGNNRLIGGGGDDTLEGGAGIDTLIGSAGNDNLQGFNGNDRLIGGRGNDTLDGSSGNNVLIGGRDADTYVTRQGSDRIIVRLNDINNSVDIVRFFDSSNDRIRLNGFNNVNVTFTTNSGDSSLLADGEAFMIFEDFEATSLSDFGL